MAKKKELTSTWMGSDHMHCKKCGKTLNFIGRLPWIVGDGVRAVGSCDECKLLLIQKENGFSKLKWVKI